MRSVGGVYQIVNRAGEVNTERANRAMVNDQDDSLAWLTEEPANTPHPPGVDGPANRVEEHSSVNRLTVNHVVNHEAGSFDPYEMWVTGFLDAYGRSRAVDRGAAEAEVRRLLVEAGRPPCLSLVDASTARRLYLAGRQGLRQRTGRLARPNAAGSRRKPGGKPKRRGGGRRF